MFEVDIIVNEFYDFVTDTLKDVQGKFCNDNYIDENSISDEIDYTVSLVEFFNKLEQINEKYSRKIEFEKILNSEVLRYENYARFKAISSLIEYCKKKAYISAQNNRFIYYQEILNKMHQEILEYFDTYNKYSKKISDYEEEILNIDNEIKNEFQKIKDDFLRGVSFSDTEKSFEKIDKLIEEYHIAEKRKADLKEDESLVTALYQSVMNKANKVLDSLNIIDDYQKIFYVNNTLKLILDLFKKYMLDLIGLDSIKILDKITFDNVEEDYKILNSIDTVYR